MGRNQVQLKVTSSLSNHNSEQDELDQEIWNRFVRAVRELAQATEDLYGLELMVDGDASA